MVTVPICEICGKVRQDVCFIVLSNTMTQNLMPLLDHWFYLCFSGSAGNEDLDTCSRMRGRVSVDIPIPDGYVTSRLRSMYCSCGELLKDADYVLGLSGKFQLLTNASSRMILGEKEYSYSLSDASLVVRSRQTNDRKVQLCGVGSWAASCEQGKLFL